MKIGLIAWVAAALLAPIPGIGADQPMQFDEQQEPQLSMPRPPWASLLFTQVKGSEQQSLEVRYVNPRTISFRFDKSGACSRHEQGMATAKPYWWLGAETNENEAGEVVTVQEYVYNKSSNCTIYFRIDEGDWEQATISEAAECGKNCPASAEPMHLEKR